jgi:endonuclease-3
MNNNKNYVDKIIKILDKQYKDIDIALSYSNPLELLIATILSAQCLDEQVNKVTQNLFKRYKGVKDYANADPRELEQIVYSTGFYKNKAKNIVGASKMILEKFKGKVPQTMDELITLPGVARKTANIVLGHAFGKPVGIAVDTHVIRISNVLRLTKEKDPVKIERGLMDIVPFKYWTRFSILIQTLGRKACKARNPNCAICPLATLCPSKI